MSEDTKENKQEQEIENSSQKTDETSSSCDTNSEVIESIKEDNKLEELEKQLKEEQEKYLRVHADFENVKKRLEKEKYQAIEFASEKFAKDLLAPIDTLEMALAAEEAAKELSNEELLAKLKEGVELTIKNFYNAFEKHGIEIVETDEFDPNLHNAIMQTQSENHEDGQIVQVMQKGYKYKDRLLRPAMVSICKK